MRTAQRSSPTSRFQKVCRRRANRSCSPSQRITFNQMLQKHLWPTSVRSITSRMPTGSLRTRFCRSPLMELPLSIGHNGSGKSGYCRILKKFCRAIVKDTIHPDVFATGTPAPAEARIRYKLEGSKDVSGVTWRDGVEGPSDIAHLSVFDSHNARLYVDERNRIDYLPYEIELLTRFGQLLTRLQDDLSTEIKVVDDRLNVGLPTGYTPGTAVSGLVDRLARSSQTRLGICRVEPLSGGDGGDWVTSGRFGPELIV